MSEGGDETEGLQGAEGDIVALTALCKVEHWRGASGLFDLWAATALVFGATTLGLTPPFSKGRVDPGFREARFAPVKRRPHAGGCAAYKAGGIFGYRKLRPPKIPLNPP